MSTQVEMLLILLRVQRTPRSEARPDLIHISETVLCLSEKRQERQTELEKVWPTFYYQHHFICKTRLFSSYYAEHENKMFSKRPGLGCRKEVRGLVQNSDEPPEQMIPILLKPLLTSKLLSLSTSNTWSFPTNIGSEVGQNQLPN